jgi:hypothetical protein
MHDLFPKGSVSKQCLVFILGNWNLVLTSKTFELFTNLFTSGTTIAGSLDGIFSHPQC